MFDLVLSVVVIVRNQERRVAERIEALISREHSLWVSTQEQAKQKLDKSRETRLTT